MITRSAQGTSNTSWRASPSIGSTVVTLFSWMFIFRYSTASWFRSMA